MLFYYTSMVGNIIEYPNCGAFQILEYSMYGGSGWLEQVLNIPPPKVVKGCEGL
jgi:hypothetical protein